jgi:hypothetical protein
LRKLPPRLLLWLLLLLLLLLLNHNISSLCSCWCYFAAITYSNVSDSGFLNPPSPSPSPPPTVQSFTCAQIQYGCRSGTLRPNGVVTAGTPDSARETICCVSAAAV